MSTGLQTPPERSSRHTVKPSAPGSMTSSTIESYAAAGAAAVAAVHHVGDDALLAQPAPEQLRQLAVVLHDQHAHRATTIHGPDEPRMRAPSRQSPDLMSTSRSKPTVASHCEGRTHAALQEGR